jgi:hypothetical protein
MFCGYLPDKLDCPVCQIGLPDFGSFNSAVSFIKFQNRLFTPLYATSMDFQLPCMQHVEQVLYMYSTMQKVRNVFFPEYHGHLRFS